MSYSRFLRTRRAYVRNLNEASLRPKLNSQLETEILQITDLTDNSDYRRNKFDEFNSEFDFELY